MEMMQQLPLIKISIVTKSHDVSVSFNPLAFTCLENSGVWLGGCAGSEL